MNIDIGVGYTKNNGQTVKVTVNEFRNSMYVHIREYKMDGDTGFWFPTKSGYAMHAEEIDTIIDLLSDASQKIAKYSRKFSNQLELFEEYNTHEC